MINSLTIRNFAIIEHQRVTFSGGFTTITGETGAGKSILIRALALILGGRASTDVIRAGEQQAIIEAEFSLSEAQLASLRPRLEERGLGDGDRLVIRRIINTSGRSRIFINECSTRLSVLQELTAGLVDVIGQHASHVLLERERHVHLLDTFASTTASTEQLGVVVGRLRALQREVARLQASADARRERAKGRRRQLDDIELAGLSPGEDERLGSALERLQHAEQLQEHTKTAFYLLREANDSALDLLSQSINQLQRISHLDEALEAMVEVLSSAQMELQETARDLGRYSDGVLVSPEEIQELEERRVLIEQLKQLHGGEQGRIEDVLAAVEGLREELDGLAGDDERVTEAAAEAAALQAAAMAAAVALSKKRQEAGVWLAELVEAELSRLGMPACRFTVAFVHRGAGGAAVEAVEDATADNLTTTGLDEVEFLISPNPGEGFKSLARTASGGELSRIMLAIKGALISTDPVGSYIFDEIDTGIGGGVAETVGRKLQGVGEARQVICITHLPQVASCAHQHLLVAKRVDGARTFSVVRSLSRAERIVEVARMLGGAEITEKTLEHAEEMISRAREPSASAGLTAQIRPLHPSLDGELPLVWGGPTPVG